MELWTPEHLRVWLPTMIAEIILAAIIGFALRKKSRRVRCIPIAVITVILWGLEIAKQVYCANDPDGYDLYRLPFHFCSLFLYYYPAFVIFNLSKKERKGIFVDVANVMTAVTSTALFMFMIIYPDMVYGSNVLVGKQDFLGVHTVVFHCLCTFVFLLIVSLKLYDVNGKRDMAIIAVNFTLFGAVSGTLANVLKTNFSDFYYCPVDFVNNARLAVIDKIGVWGQVIFVIVCTLVIIAFTTICYWIFRLIIKIQGKICDKMSA